MAATPNINLTLPTVGADNNSWGNELNGNLSNLDALWANIGNVAFGTAALKNTGTSGAAVPLLNGANAWTGAQTFSGGLSGSLAGNVTGNVSGSSGSCTGNAATATTAASCSGNAASATVAASCSGNAHTSDFAQALTTGGQQIVWDGGQWHTNGSFYADGNGNFNDVAVRSDARLKTEIQDAPEMGDLIDCFRVATFRKAGRSQIGVIAQEVERFMPDVIRHGAEAFEGGEPLKSICATDIFFAMLREVQSLRRRIAELEGAR